MAWDAAVDAVADLNDGMSEDAGWPVLEAARVSSDAKVDQLTLGSAATAPAPQTRTRSRLGLQQIAGVDNAV